MNLVRKTFVFELIPNGADIRSMRKFCGCTRFVYNKALALQKERYEKKEKYLGYSNITSLLPLWKKELPWLKECPSQALQQSLKDLDRAYQNLFEKRAKQPRFHKKGRKDRFRYPQGVKLEEQNKRIFLPKIGWVRYRRSRFITGTIKNTTVKYKAGKWFVCIQTEEDVPKPTLKATSSVGIDMGVARFATLSNGKFYPAINIYRKYEEALAKAQRERDRKVKFSKNWHKADFKLQKLYVHIANVRLDYLHKVTTDISKNHALVFIEDLKVSNMSKSASGTVESPGHNVKAKSGLNKSILDQGWYKARVLLDYKLKWRGGMLITVSPQNTSRTCPDCGYISKDNRKSQAVFKCVNCGYEGNADVVGAINILRAGHARLACDMCGSNPPSDAVRSLSAGTH